MDGVPLIEQQDWMLVAALIALTAAVVSVLWIIYGTQRTWDLKLEHQEHIRMMNHEIMMVRSKLASREVRDRVLSSTPVGRLMDNGGNE